MNKLNRLKYFLTLLLLPQLSFCQIDKPKETSFLKLKSNDVEMMLSGELEEDYFFYTRVRTLSDNFYDQNDFFRHKFYLNFDLKQGVAKYGKPAVELGARLTNYVVWQQNNYYMPFSREDVRSKALGGVVTAEDVTTKTILPLIYLEEAWLKINFDTFTQTWNKNPTFLKAGFFQYEVGRGVVLGYHDDLAVEYMGWPGTGNFTRYPQMPPGVLVRCDIFKNLSFDTYFMKWIEVDANLDDVMYPSRAQRLNTVRMERGSNKDRYNIALKFDYEPDMKDNGSMLLEPYWVYTHAPELSVEFDSDSKANLHTLGVMLDYDYEGFEVNCEVAGQFGDQTMFAIDRNIKQLSTGDDGSTNSIFSHIFFEDNTSRDNVAVQNKSATSAGTYNPNEYLTYIVNTRHNRNLNMQGKKITTVSTPGGNKDIYNANLFGNARFRPEYKLHHCGFMALLDIGYSFKKIPLRLGGAFGHISGDNYPYNEEVSKTYHGFIPMRSRYKGMQVKNTLIFDRLVIPRPLNMSYRTMYAFDNLKDLSNLEFVGLGATWYPLKKKEKCFLNSDLMFFWESATLYKWDKNGHHPVPEIEKQIKYDRALLGFPGVTPQYPTIDDTNKGWISNEVASSFIGAELDLRAEWSPIKDCAFSGQVCLFFPGQLYKDLKGQPNILTQYVDNQGQMHYESLGDKFAFALIAGVDYKF